jgi:hypothetical protein
MPEDLENKFERCEPDDPHRCQTVHADQQCPFRAVEGSKYCTRHGGNVGEKKRDMQLYMAALYKDRIGEHIEHPKVKTLREEIAILRITLDYTLEHCKNAKDVLLYSGKILELTREIAKIVVSCQKLEAAMGYVLDKSQALAWVQEVLDFITEEIKDPDKLQKLARQMIDSLDKRTL